MPSLNICRTSSLLGILAVSAACLGNPIDADVQAGDPELHILFVGNSLTYTNDLPTMVQTIAEAAGHTLEYSLSVAPNVSLEDHWNSGVEETIRTAAADIVVMQQGPSSLPENQAHLKEWTETLTEVIRDVGGEPALFMIWPEESRMEAFGAVYDSYLNASTAVDGLFAPAGEAWRFAWELNPELQFYGADGYHPSNLGSQVAALTIFRVLFDEPVTGLPSHLEPFTEGLPVMDLGINAPTILQAVEEAIAAVNAG